MRKPSPELEVIVLENEFYVNDVIPQFAIRERTQS